MTSMQEAWIGIGAPHFHGQTPLECLIEDARVAWLLRSWYQQAEWERAARAEIHAMAVGHHRSIGQLFRQAERRLRAAIEQDPLKCN